MSKGIAPEDVPVHDVRQDAIGSPNPSETETETESSGTSTNATDAPEADAELIELLTDISAWSGDNRSERVCGYVDPDLYADAKESVEADEYPSLSIMMDVALRRQVLHELESRPEYAHILDMVPNLREMLEETPASQHSDRAGDDGSVDIER